MFIPIPDNFRGDNLIVRLHATGRKRSSHRLPTLWGTNKILPEMVKPTECLASADTEILIFGSHTKGVNDNEYGPFD